MDHHLWNESVGFQKVLPVTQLFLQIQRISKVFPRNESESI